MAGGAALGASAPARADSLPSEARAVAVASTDRPGGFYTPNRAPLQASIFQKLPIGAITLQGWLRGQLEMQAG